MLQLASPEVEMVLLQRALLLAEPSIEPRSPGMAAVEQMDETVIASSSAAPVSASEVAA